MKRILLMLILASCARADQISCPVGSKPGCIVDPIPISTPTPTPTPTPIPTPTPAPTPTPVPTPTPIADSVYSSCFDAANIVKVANAADGQRISISPTNTNVTYDMRGVSILAEPTLPLIDFVNPINICVTGGSVVAKYPAGFVMDWTNIKHSYDVGGFHTTHPQAGTTTFDHIYVEGVEDGLMVARTAGAADQKWVVSHSYFKNVPDDTIENDGYRSGKVSNILAEGVHHFYSSRNTVELPLTLLIEDSVIGFSCKPDLRNDNYTGPGACPVNTSTQKMFKLGTVKPDITINNTVIYYPFIGKSGPLAMCLPSDGHFSNVKIVWGASIPYPCPALPGVTMTTDVGVYNTAKSTWLIRHGCTGSTCAFLNKPAPTPTPTPVPTATPTPVPTPTPTPVPVASWNSGFSMCNNLAASIPGSITSINTWRGTPAKVWTMWHPHSTWAEMENWGGQIPKMQLLHAAGLVSVGMGMLPVTNKSQFAECARGDFDTHYNTLAQTIKDNAGANAIVRLGWEYNGGNGSFPWGVHNMQTNVDDTTTYKACFRHIAGILKAKSADFKIDWTSMKAGKMIVSVAEAYPGDDVVDIIGVDYYNTGEIATTDQASWDKAMPKLYHGGPLGLQKWLDFAKSHGKKLSIPEWGQMNTLHGGVGDAPFFISAMYAFMKTNAANIAYDSYFNCGDATEDATKIFPATVNPLSSAKYAEMFSK